MVKQRVGMTKEILMSCFFVTMKNNTLTQNIPTPPPQKRKVQQSLLH